MHRFYNINLLSRVTVSEVRSCSEKRPEICQFVSRYIVRFCVTELITCGFLTVFVPRPERLPAISSTVEFHNSIIGQSMKFYIFRERGYSPSVLVSWEATQASVREFWGPVQLGACNGAQGSLPFTLVKAVVVCVCGGGYCWRQY